MRSIHVTEKKKYQREYIRENGQRTAQGKMYGRKYATYTVFARVYDESKSAKEYTKERCKTSGEEGKKYRGSGSKVFIPTS